VAYVRWHHVVTHGIVVAVGATALAAIFAKKKLRAAAALLISGVIGIKYGRTFVEAILPKRADEAVVKVLRNRFGGKDTTEEAG